MSDKYQTLMYRSMDSTMEIGTCIHRSLTHLAYRANAKKCDISNNNSQF